MSGSELPHVEIVDSEVLYDLRRKVLRGGDRDVLVSDPRDNDDSSLHMAGLLEGRVVAAGSFYPSTSPVNPARVTYQLRFLATDPRCQSQGVGSLLMRAAESRLISRGVEQLWANGRDSALGFYERTRWQIVAGSQHLSPETQLPHTIIYKSLRSSEPWELGWATISDAEALASLREEMHFAISMRSYNGDWINRAAQYFAQVIGDETVIAAVARTSSGEIVSLAAATLRHVAPSPWYPNGSSAYVHSVSTRPMFRRRGISRALMVRLLDELRARQVERVELHAAPDGERVYRSLGFEERYGGPELRLSLSRATIN